MEITGKIHRIGELQQITDTFSKREFVLDITDNPEYPNYIQLEMIGESSEVLDKVKVGQDVTAHINLRGRLWTNKEGVEICFNTLVAWRLDFGSKVQPQSAYQQAEVVSEEEGEDDLPF